MQIELVKGGRVIAQGTVYKPPDAIPDCIYMNCDGVEVRIYGIKRIKRAVRATPSKRPANFAYINGRG